MTRLSKRNYLNAAPPQAFPLYASRINPTSARPILKFSSRGLKNSTITCPKLSIEYKISTSRKWFRYERTTFTCRDKRSPRRVTVASWERRTYGRTYLQINPAGLGNMNVIKRITPKEEDVFPQVSGRRSGFKFERTFVANNGKRYTWKSRMRKSLQLFRDDKPNAPIATFKRRHFFRCQWHNRIQLGPAGGWEDILDYIVVTGVIANVQVVENTVQIIDIFNSLLGAAAGC